MSPGSRALPTWDSVDVEMHEHLLSDVLALPTAPFAEHLVIRYVERYCKARKHARPTRDEAGNLLVRVRKGGQRTARPVCITAHLDHPGFVADRMIRTGRLRALWRGGVPIEYFRGSRVRFYADDRWNRGTVRSVTVTHSNGRRRVDTASIDVSRDVPPGSVGMWDFPDPVVRGRRIHARACDDLAGVAALLYTIDRLNSSRSACDAYFLFTRAEEVGFIGAMAAARLGTIPKKCYVVAMETSAELPQARMGDGPILRVGDKTSVFSHAVTAHCGRVASGLAAADRRFRFQRKLMDGGTCESTAYCSLGYEATGMCIALGNYHNVDARRRRLRPEFVNLDDLDNVVRWFVSLARSKRPYTGRDQTLHDNLLRLERDNASLLRSTYQQGEK